MRPHHFDSLQIHIPKTKQSRSSIYSRTLHQQRRAALFTGNCTPALQKTFPVGFCISLAGIWPVPCSMAPTPRSSVWRARHWLRALPFFLHQLPNPSFDLAACWGVYPPAKMSAFSTPFRSRSAQILFTFKVHFKKLLQYSVLFLSHSDVNQSSDKTSVLNRKSNKLPLLIWTCILLLDSARLIKNTSANQFCHLLQETLESDDTNSLEVSQPPKSLFASLQNIFHSHIRPNLPLARPPRLQELPIIAVMIGRFFFRQANCYLSHRLQFPRYKQTGTSYPIDNINYK